MTILGIFTDSAKAARAVAAVRRDQLGEVVVYGPAPDHAIDRALQVKVSPVRTFTLIGGLLGCATGFALPIYTVLDWPLITGGKPLISIPPFVVIAFELTILFGAVSGLIGFLVLTGLPKFRQPAVSEPRFTDDRFGVLVTCAEEQGTAVHALLEQAGAEEVKNHV